MKDEQKIFNFNTLETNERDGYLPSPHDNEAANAMQLRQENNLLKLLALDEAIRKTKDALHKATSEVEALKRNGGHL